MPVEHEECLSFFDCKLRKMFIVAPIRPPKTVEVFDDDEATPAPSVAASSDRQQPEEAKEDPPVAESVPVEDTADDLLFDVV